MIKFWVSIFISLTSLTYANDFNQAVKQILEQDPEMQETLSLEPYTKHP